MKSEQINTQEFYKDVYRPAGHDYGFSLSASPSAEQMAIVTRNIAAHDVGETKRVLEIGCGLAKLSACHPNWQGIEYSGTAVAMAKQSLGHNLSVQEGDARSLPMESSSIDFVFSFAALEHIPQVELAFAEIDRVLKPGGVALIAPAWNCRPWTVKKLQQRPYTELHFTQKIGKFLIPLREHLLWRMLCASPMRLYREAKLASGARLELDYSPLEPDLSLWSRYPHISDDDAFVSMDAHSALTYFRSRRYELCSHPTFWRRVTSRGEEIVVRKPC